MSTLSLKDCLRDILGLGLDGISDDIYDALFVLDIDRLNALYDELNKLRSETSQLVGSAKRSWQSGKNQRVGKKFEELISCIFFGSELFDVEMNLRSMTSDIDITLTLKPLSTFIPYLRGHHTIYGESKCHEKGFKKEWVDEMRTTLKDHGANVGLIFVFCESRNIIREAKVSISNGVVENKLVVPFGKKQIEELRAGVNLLKVLQDQFRDSRTHNSKLAI